MVDCCGNTRTLALGETFYLLHNVIFLENDMELAHKPQVVFTNGHDVTLPEPTRGLQIAVKNNGVGTTTVDSVIGTVEDTSLAGTESATYVSDGTDWWVL